MFCKLDIRRKLIVTLALSQDNRKIVVRYFVNRAPEFLIEGMQYTTSSILNPNNKNNFMLYILRFICSLLCVSEGC